VKKSTDVNPLYFDPKKHNPQNCGSVVLKANYHSDDLDGLSLLHVHFKILTTIKAERSDTVFLCFLFDHIVQDFIVTAYST